MDASFISKIFGMEIEFDKRYNIQNTEFDITPNINWRGGEFGDSGSCFLQGGHKSTSSVLMMRNGILAYRLYRDGKGSGRGWLYKIPKLDNAVLIFNIQGRDYAKDVLAKMEAIFGVTNTQVEVRSSGSVGSYVYADGRTGYILSREPISGIKAVDLELKISFGECTECGKGISDLPVNQNGNIYCGPCFNKLYFFCFNCSKISPHTEAVHLTGGKQIVCGECEVHNCPGCGIQLCRNLLAYEVRRKYGAKKIYRRLWYCNNAKCRDKMLEELAKPIKKKIKEG